MSKKIRFAVVGLGHIAQVAVLPAFQNAHNAELVALVSGDGVKLHELSHKYNIVHMYTYDRYEELLKSGLIDAVYIALPNTLHRQFAERAAYYGIHILCEKPLSVSEEDCWAMIDAAKKNRVHLMTAYRLHFEKANMKAVDIVQSGQLGDVRTFNSSFTMQVTDAENIRLKKNMGGGTLYDIGIYCINASRYIFRSEPLEVLAMTANRGGSRFEEVEEMVSAILRFPQDRLATFTCSFGASDEGYYQVIGTKGSLCVDSAYDYAEEMQHTLVIGDKTMKQKFSKRDQFAAELIYFSNCIHENRSPEPNGLEGLMDVRIINALYESAATRRVVKIKSDDVQLQRPDVSQIIRRSPHPEPEVIHAVSPNN